MNSMCEAYRRSVVIAVGLTVLVLVSTLLPSGGLTASRSLQTPEQFFGFAIGADNRLARWDKIVEYMELVSARSDRVRIRDLGSTTSGNPFIALEISSPDTLKNVERFKQLERRLYFGTGTPSARDRDEIFREGKVVVLVTAGVHANEVGPTQMALELVHRLVTDDSPATRKILENVIFLLVPSANPDGQIMITDWFNTNLGTPFEASPLPYLSHPYAGHDLNRDMYMFTQRESQHLARLVWHDWFPSVWLDQHQMGSYGPRMFVMPAADPINPNVHPLIYRWNGILGQSQAAALEAAGKDGIIYNSTYTNFWQGALAWSGWWHNQIGLLTEIASAGVAGPIDQLYATAGQAGAVPEGRGALRRFDNAPLLPPSDVTPRTEYPRPWMGGRWTLGDIVDYGLISTLALLETVADRREAILRQIYEVNRQTVEDRKWTDTSAILVPVVEQQDAREVDHLVDRLEMGGVEVYRADRPFESERRTYAAGTFVIPMTQVFARYAKDLLEPQTYPGVGDGSNAPVESPYDVTAWSLGMLFGVNVDFANGPLPPGVRLKRARGQPRTPGRVIGRGSRFVFDYKGPDTAVAINRLLKDGARIELDRRSRVAVTHVPLEKIEGLARDLRLSVEAMDPAADPDDQSTLVVRPPRIAVYASWTDGNSDEGWTRWVLEEYEFVPTRVNNADIRRGELSQRFDAIIIPDLTPRDILQGYSAESIRPEYRGGIGEAGAQNLARFVEDGGTLVMLGAASDLAISRLPIPVRNIKRDLRRDQHFAPGTIVHLQVDVSHPLGQGMAAQTYGFSSNSPFFAIVEGATPFQTTVAARFPSVNVLGSGWLRGEELMAGRAAVVLVEMNRGRVVLFGLRPQHRGQTHATFPMLFNALYLAAAEREEVRTPQ